MKKGFLCFVSAAFVVASVLSCSCDTPNNPTSVRATAQSSNEILVSWNAVSGATSYEVHRSTSSLGTYSTIGTTVSTSYISSGLSSKTYYYYKVKAVNSCGASSLSTYASARTN